MNSMYEESFQTQLSHWGIVGLHLDNVAMTTNRVPMSKEFGSDF